MQPQRDVCRLHSLPYHPQQVFAQGVQVCFVAQLGREGFQGLSCIVLAAVEAPVYEGLDATPQGGEQGRYKEGGGNDRQGGLLTCEADEDTLQHHDAYEVERDQRGGEQAVDEGTVY